MDANIVTTQFSATVCFVWAIQQLKKAKWFPLLEQKGQWLIKRGVSIIGAFFIHTSIGYVWNPTLDANGNRHLDLAIPTFAVMAVGLWHWFSQFVIQESWYQAAYNRFGLSSLGAGVPEAQTAQSSKSIAAQS